MITVKRSSLKFSCYVYFWGHRKVSPYHLPMKSMRSHFLVASSRLVLGRQFVFGYYKTVDSCSISYPLTNKFSRRLAYHLRATPLRDCTKATIIAISYRWGNVDDRHKLQYKLAMCWLGVPCAVEDFEFQHFEVWREAHRFNSSKLRYGDNRGHLGLLFLFCTCWLTMSTL